jgi:hypothetical protein
MGSPSSAETLVSAENLQREGPPPPSHLARCCLFPLA